MKTPVLNSIIILLFICLFSINNACKKEESAKVPVLSTTAVTAISPTTATSGGFITSDGGAIIISNGVCWSTAANPSTSDSKTVDAVGIAQFVSSLSGLTAGTTYHVRAYATNSVGTAFGVDRSFSTSGQAPESLTQPATNITTTGATLNATVNPHYLSTIVTFEYGTTTSYGITVTATQSPVTGNNMTNINIDISGLTSGTTYHFRVKTENSLGITYGNDLTFETSPGLPVLTTTPVSNITTTYAQTGGNITSDGGANLIVHGVCWSIKTNPTIEENTTSEVSEKRTFSSSLTGLTPNTTYYLRAYATNSVGTAYGNEISFITLDTNCGTITDIDGNTYNTVRIGTQCWMSENLKTTKFNDYSAIPYVSDRYIWPDRITPAYCWYNNDSIINKTTYGGLYNWYAVNTEKLCPTGWHVPSDGEWSILADFLDGPSVAGGELKTTGTIESGDGLWRSPNRGATNISGFNGLPGGAVNDESDWGLGQEASFWSATGSIYWYIGNDWQSFNRNSSDLTDGYSVRCLRNN